MYPLSAQITTQQADFLTKIVHSRKVKSVLELGTLYGYSAEMFAKAVGPSGLVTTVERMEENYDTASKNLHQYSNITIIHADAAEYLPTINTQFDLIFIDANKTQYKHYLKHALRLLAKGGVIIADNTNFRGLVFTDSEPPKRYHAIVLKLRKFHQFAQSLAKYSVKQIDIEDGMTMIEEI